MIQNDKFSNIGRIGLFAELWKNTVATPAIFGRLIRLTFVLSALLMLYWMIISSDRYVSEANVIVQRTDYSSGKSLDVSNLLSGTGGTNRADQLRSRAIICCRWICSKSLMKLWTFAPITATGKRPYLAHVVRRCRTRMVPSTLPLAREC